MQDLAEGQAILVNPQLSLAGHARVGRRWANGDTGRQLAPCLQIFLLQIANVGGKARAVDVECVALEEDAAAGLSAVEAHVLGSDEEGREISLGSGPFEEVLRLLPRTISLAGQGLVTIDLNLEPGAGQGPTGLRGEHQTHLALGKVGLPFQVEAVLFAGPPGAGSRGQGNGPLGDIGDERVGACLLRASPGGSYFILG